jgi:uncharacterized protein
MAMHVGVLTLRLEITDALTLKDKRHVVHSVLDRVRATFNVSAAEIGSLDNHREALLGFAGVSNDAAYVHGQMELVVRQIEREGRALVLDYEIDLA